jgi:cyclophilin family peptidyl-prolyl cis-trans isomerase
MFNNSNKVIGNKNDKDIPSKNENNIDDQLLNSLEKITIDNKPKKESTTNSFDTSFSNSNPFGKESAAVKGLGLINEVELSNDFSSGIFGNNNNNNEKNINAKKNVNDYATIKENKSNILASQLVNNNSNFKDEDILNLKLKEEEENKLFKLIEVYLEISIDGESKGKIIIQLRNDIVPKTCENFRALCTGEVLSNKEFGKASGEPLHYKGCSLHRIIPGFMAQGGAYCLSNGSRGESIYKGKFADENFVLKHTARGDLSMANRGPNTNGSSFFITFDKCSHLDEAHVVFGKVIQGMEILDLLEKTETKNDSPVDEIVIIDCGEINTHNSEVSSLQPNGPTSSLVAPNNVLGSSFGNSNSSNSNTSNNNTSNNTNSNDNNNNNNSNNTNNNNYTTSNDNSNINNFNTNDTSGYISTRFDQKHELGSIQKHELGSIQKQNGDQKGNQKGDRVPFFCPSNNSKTPVFCPSNNSTTPVFCPSNNSKTPVFSPSSSSKTPEFGPSNNSKSPVFGPSNNSKTPVLGTSNDSKTPVFSPSYNSKTPEFGTSKNISSKSVFKIENTNPQSFNGFGSHSSFTINSTSNIKYPAFGMSDKSPDLNSTTITGIDKISSKGIFGSISTTSLQHPLYNTTSSNSNSVCKNSKLFSTNQTPSPFSNISPLNPPSSNSQDSNVSDSSSKFQQPPSSNTFSFSFCKDNKSSNPSNQIPSPVINVSPLTPTSTINSGSSFEQPKGPTQYCPMPTFNFGSSIPPPVATYFGSSTQSSVSTKSQSSSIFEPSSTQSPISTKSIPFQDPSNIFPLTSTFTFGGLAVKSETPPNRCFSLDSSPDSNDNGLSTNITHRFSNTPTILPLSSVLPLEVGPNNQYKNIYNGFGPSSSSFKKIIKNPTSSITTTTTNTFTSRSSNTKNPFPSNPFSPYIPTMHPSLFGDKCKQVKNITSEFDLLTEIELEELKFKCISIFNNHDQINSIDYECIIW